MAKELSQNIAERNVPNLKAVGQRFRPLELSFIIDNDLKQKKTLKTCSGVRFDAYFVVPI